MEKPQEEFQLTSGIEKNSQSAISLKERYRRALQWWEATNPDADTELVYHNHYELLIAVILSAQCTDARVNQVTPRLFAIYPDVYALAQADSNEVLHLISSISYPNAKAEYLCQTARQLVEHHNGEIPSDYDALLALPGVGRKTANVMRVCAFGIPSMPVDTHVFRVANRIGLTKTTTPKATEKELLRNIPNNKLGKAHHWLVLHGRYICTAMRPSCDKCGLTAICKHYAKNSGTQKKLIN